MSLPKTIEVIQCTELSLNCWYAELIGVSFTVIDSTGNYYIVDEYEITANRCIPLTINKCDCKIVSR